MENFYKKHMFFCNNIRKDEKKCCSQSDAKTMYNYAKDALRKDNTLGKGNFGVSESRCLGRCEDGPVIVIYPDNIWYTYIDTEDIDEIIKSHIYENKIVKRLEIVSS